MSLKKPVNLRYATETKTDEEIAIPGSSPYQYYLDEVPSDIEGVTIRRLGTLTKSGTGTGVVTASGNYQGLTSKSYVVKIDTPGGLGVATFKWSNDNGVTWNSTLVQIPSVTPIILELGVYVSFSDGTYVLDDQFSFMAEVWTEVDYVPIATKTFQVDYSNGKITFLSADASVTVYATYEGRGSTDKAEFITQLVDALNAGAVFMGEQNTNALTVVKAVAYDLSLASAASGGKPAIGFVKSVGSVDGEVVTFGPLGGFTGLVAGSVYYLSTTDGEITPTPPLQLEQFQQKVGRALTTTTLLVRISDEITNVTGSMTTTSSTVSTSSSSSTSSTAP